MSHSLKLGLTVAALAALGLSAANPAAAQSTTYNFQSGSTMGAPTYTGVGVLLNGGNSTSTFNREVYPGTGTTNYAGGTANTIYDSNHVANSALLFQYDAGAFYPPPAATASGSDATLLGTYSFESGARTMQLTGLAANTPFKACFYGEGTNTGGYQSYFNLTNSTFTTVFSSGVVVSTNAAAFLAPTTPTAGNGNYVVETGTTDTSGNIYVAYHGNFNGVQFQVGTPSAAPEPSQLAGLGFTALGALGLILKSRKRSVSTTPAA